MNRETWLHLVAEKMAPRFEELGFPLPPFRVAIGFTSRGIKSKADAEVWDKSVSADGLFVIHIRPDQDDPAQVAALLAHELTHAAVGLAEGHKGNFARVMKALGMMRPFTSTVRGPEFNGYIAPILDEVGPLPHAALMYRSGGMMVRRIAGGMFGEAMLPGETPPSSAPPKQGTRMIKVCCAECGYTARVTRKWLDVGPPHCPSHGAMSEES